jgi:hypothetical protein
VKLSLALLIADWSGSTQETAQAYIYRPTGEILFAKRIFFSLVLSRLPVILYTRRYKAVRRLHSSTPAPIFEVRAVRYGT